MLPTHGSVMSIFLLANAARHATYPDVASWIRAAQERSSFMAGAINHSPAATFLCRTGLASAADGIMLSARLRAVSETADRSTLVAIASMMVELAPPVWLPFVVGNGELFFELIPSTDLQAIEWLRPELNEILLTLARREPFAQDAMPLGLGRAAELAALAALTATGAVTAHVAMLSDSLGYDIESRLGGVVRRWEVKGCTERTAGAFHLSRNEFDKCTFYGPEWTVLQIEFTREALVSEEILAEHVAFVRELPSAALVACVPINTGTFRWEDSALVSPPADSWTQSVLVIPDTMRLPSFDALGRDVLDARQEWKSSAVNIA